MWLPGHCPHLSTSVHRSDIYNSEANINITALNLPLHPQSFHLSSFREGGFNSVNGSNFNIQSIAIPLSCPFVGATLAGDDIRQKLEFHHTHLEVGALGYIETFLFYWSWVFFQNNPPPRPIFVFQKARKKIFF